ncbi:MAG: Eco57I restriction-modification methylase domain-containing protein, partial [Elusimicrobiaceae bacterium]|nr:Eco57I restriction-modification methylase domain-containing protein [Elusimicrobiaceae bacterium]
AAGAGGLLIPFWLILTQLREQLNPTLTRAELLRFIWQHNLYAADIQPQAIFDLWLRATLTLLAYQQPIPSHEHLYTWDSLEGTAQSIWKQNCPDVFQQGGFDIYLANPPYIGQKTHKTIFYPLRQNPRWQPWITPKIDLLYLFFYLAFELLKPTGAAGLLTTSYFTHAAGAYPLRKRLKQQATLWRLIDFGEKRIFKHARGQHNLITVFTPGSADIPCRCGKEGKTETPQQNLFFGSQLFLNTTQPSALLEKALAKMTKSPYRLSECAHLSSGLMTGCDRAFLLSCEERNTFKINQQEQKKLKPFFKNSDISSYTAAQTPRFYLIDFFYPNDRDTDFSHYPNLMKHLAQFKDKLLARRQNNNGIHKQLAQGKYWFGSVRRKLDFETEKIVVPQRASSNRFAYVKGPWYASSDFYFITAPTRPVSLWYLLALFNSAPYYTWLFYKGKRKGNLLELYAQPLGQLPIPAASPAVQNSLEKLSRQIYNLKKKNATADYAALQRQIDLQVCTLFGLTADETKAVLNVSNH